ncbi:MAG: hypothetical protein KAJ31_08630 [Deltaproteobacteria bacterium]|nr:hypothetical protein [Deltaproteobacteria bacterium]
MINRTFFISRKMFILALVVLVSVFSWTTIASASGTFISSANNNRILKFEPGDGEFFRIFADGLPLSGPEGLLFTAVKKC